VVESSPMTKIVGLGLGAALLLALMYLFTLNQVADTSATQTAKYIDTFLEGNLAPDRPTRVTMTRDAKGTHPPRTYVVRLHPVAKIMGDPRALLRLCESARDRVFEQVETLEAPVTVLCVATTADAAQRFAWRRTGGEAGFRVEVVDPPPDVGSDDAGSDDEGSGDDGAGGAEE